MEGGIGGDSGLLHLVGSKSIVMMIIVYTMVDKCGKEEVSIENNRGLGTSVPETAFGRSQK